MSERSAPTTASMRPVLARDGIFNVRDIGGPSTRDSSTVATGRVLRGDALHRASTSVPLLRDYGLVRVLDLRDERERDEYGVFDADGIEVQHHPVLDPTFVWDDDDHDEPSTLLLTRYQLILESFASRFVGACTSIAEVLDSDDDGVVAYHCAVGKDRTGLLTALLLDTLGVDEDQIVADYARSGTAAAVQVSYLWTFGRPEGSVTDEQLATGVWSARPETMRATLQWLQEHHGGAETYLLDAGLSPDTIGSLRRALLVAPAG